MKQFFDYLNTNGALATIIGIILGWILNFISNIVMDYRTEKRKIRENEKLELKEKIKNRPELRVVNNNIDLDISFEIFIGSFKVEYKNKNYEIIHSKDVLKKSNLDHKDVTLKNIGKTSIECIDIVSSSKKSLIVCEYDILKMVINNNTVLYNAKLDRKIMPDEEVKIRIYYRKNNLPYLPFSSTLGIYIQDENNDIWEQPYFYERDNLYKPILKTYKDFIQEISVDDAYECFEKPYLW